MLGYSVLELALFSLLSIGIVTIVFHSILKKDYYSFFSPKVFLCLYFVYYIVIPFFHGSIDFYNEVKVPHLQYVLLGALLELIFFSIAFEMPIKRHFFSKTISLFNHANVTKIAIVLFAMAFLFNGLFYGFSLSFIREQAADLSSGEESSGHAEMYLTYLVSLFPISASILWFKGKKKTSALFFFLAISIYLIGGFRFRLLVLAIIVFVSFHLYPQPKPIKWKLWAPLVFMFYISMGIIESTRSYGGGLDVERLIELSEGNILNSKAMENDMVYAFSNKTMINYENRGFIYFEPILTAVLMPIPRAMFPWKPDGTYLREANIMEYGDISVGNVYLHFVEGFISFGWIGIVIWGTVLGYLSKILWSTYIRNRESLAAVLLIASYNGVLYIFVSRGPLAHGFTYYVYYILMFCWLSRLVNYVIKRKTRISI